MQRIEEPKVTASLVSERHASLMARLRHAATDAGRDPGGFRVVAVTKGFGLEVVRAAVDAGISSFGENRVQEADAKVSALPDLDWHFIGRLQSNKARRALALFGTIHSVDSVGLLERLERIAHDEGRHPRILLQVNLSGESQKAGIAAGAVDDMADTLRGLRHLHVVGLMTIGRLGSPAAESRTLFAALRGLRDRLAVRSGLELPELSMGMTADAVEAVAEGSTLVRVGTALFGPRPH